MKYFLIVAVSINNIIGTNGTLPWHLPEDLSRFKRLTSGKAVVMGRRTYESIKPALKDRFQIVMTRQKDYRVPDGVVVAHSLQDVAREVGRLGRNELWVIGGGEIYELFAPLADELHVTRVLAKVEGDVKFPVSFEGWGLVDEKSRPSVDGKPAYLFQTWSRI